MVFSDQLLQACGQEFRDRVPHSFDFKKRFYVQFIEEIFQEEFTLLI
jgi:hypothetical protein